MSILIAKKIINMTTLITTTSIVSISVNIIFIIIIQHHITINVINIIAIITALMIMTSI